MDITKELIHDLIHELLNDIRTMEQNKDTHDSKKSHRCQMARNAIEHDKSITAFIIYVNTLEDFLFDKLMVDGDMRYYDEFDIIEDKLHELCDLLDNYILDKEEENA